MPIRITGYSADVIEAVVVELEQDGCIGRGECAGVYYRNDTAGSIKTQLEALRSTIEAGITREALGRLLPPGGARNALDCALWDLEAKRTGRAVWRIAGLEPPRPLITTFTCHADEPATMAAKARGYPDARAIKLKLTGERVDADRVRAVRDALPRVWLAVDANQGFTRAFLEELLPLFVELHVALIEQPFPVGQEGLLEGLASPIPIAADESVQCSADIASLPGRFDVVNIKLDKCGGLTEGLATARVARALGLHTMVGNMGGTSLAIAPAFLIAQLCDYADLDGPALLTHDREVSVEYSDGFISCPAALWGA